MTTNIRKLPAPVDGQRLETGAVQFGEDWPGLFIRGDNAAYYAMAISNLQDELKGYNGGPHSSVTFNLSLLGGLATLIQLDVICSGHPQRYMTQAELLEMAVAFDVGPEATINGYRTYEQDGKFYIKELGDKQVETHHHVLVESRGEKWCISHGRSVLSKDGEWLYESFPSERTEDFIERTRFKTAVEAIGFFRAHRQKEWLSLDAVRSDQ